MPETSIVMACYNAESFVKDAIQSCRSQSYKDWELIVVDDCSTDSSVDVVRSTIQMDNRIRLIESKQNGGPAAARNTAIAKATGRFIAFLDADDLWLPDKLRTQIGFMKDNQVVFSYSDYHVLTQASGEVLGERIFAQSVTFDGLRKENIIGCLTAVYDTRALGKVYMPGLRRRQDFGLWLSILKKTERAVNVGATLAIYRKVDGSISSSLLRNLYWNS